MTDTVDLGTGPSIQSPFSIGIEPLETVVGPLVGGENVLWATNGDSGYIREQITRASRGAILHVEDPDLKSLRSQPLPATVIIGMSAVADEPRWPSNSSVARTAQSIFAATTSVCHWFIDADHLPQATWSWATQIVVEVADGAASVTRADGRAIGRTRVPLRDEAGTSARRVGGGALALGRGVRAARVGRGWSQTELARRVGISASAISQLERGLLGISLDTAIDISDQLGLTLDMLAHGDTQGSVVIEQRLGIPPEFAPNHDDTPIARNTLRVHQLAPQESLAPPIGPAGRITILVGSGTVCIERIPDRTLARAGDIIAVHRASGATIRNLGDRPAIVFSI